MACEPDLVHPKILIELQAELVLPRVDIFNQSLHDGSKLMCVLCLRKMTELMLPTIDRLV